MNNIKLVVVGDGDVGKTCLLISFVTNSYPNEYIPTILDCHVSFVEVDGQRYTISPWDTARQSDYDRLRLLSYPNTDKIKCGYPELKHFCPDVPIILVGTKLDLRNDKEQVETANGRTVSTEEGLRMQSIDDNVVKYMECSALTQFGVREVFEEAARAALKYKTASTKSRQKKCDIM